MFDYYYASDSGDPDWPAPIVFRLDALDPETLRSLPGFLIDSLPLRFNLKGIDTHLDARPLSFEVGGDPLLTERAVWGLLVEMADGASHVTKYVDAVLDALGTDREVGFYSHLDVVGQDPIYAYFDRYLRRAQLDSPQDLEPCLSATDCFLRFLRRCDQDHETFQDDYIELALRFLGRCDRQRFLDLLVFRLSTGQHSELSANQYDLLEGNGILKSVIDGILPIVDPGWSLRVNILELCYAVYGSNEELTEDVLTYYRDRVDLGEEHDLKNFQRRLQRIQEDRDLAWNRWRRNLNTGFHRYDKGKQEWSKLV